MKNERELTLTRYCAKKFQEEKIGGAAAPEKICLSVWETYMNARA